MTTVRQLVRRSLHRIVRDASSGRSFALLGSGRWEQRFTDLLFPAGAEPERLLRPTIGPWPSVACRLAARHGVVVVTGSRYERRARHALLAQPAFVAMRLDLRESEAALVESLPRSARSDIKRTRNRHFTIEVTNDPSWAEEYFHRFHRPTITGRHGDDGFVMEPAAMAKMVSEGGEFLRLHHEGQLIAALLNSREGDSYHLQRVGWLDGADAIRRLGVISALDWYAIRRARSLGCTTVQFGGTPPFVTGGIFQYKSKWGATPDLEHTVWGDYYLHLDPSHSTARALLEREALLVHTPAGLSVLSGLTPEAAGLLPAAAANVRAWYQLRERPGPPEAGLPGELAAWFRRL